MWMTKDGITRHVSENEVQKFKNLGFKETALKEEKLKLSDDKKADKKAENKNGSSAQNKADAL